MNEADERNQRMRGIDECVIDETSEKMRGIL